MRKNRLLVFFAIALVFSMIFAMMVGCSEKPQGNDNPVIDGGNTGGNNGGDETGGDNEPDKGGVEAGTGGDGSTQGGSSYTITNADAYITFDVKAANASDIVVKDNVGNVVAADIKKDGDIFKVWAPNGGYVSKNIYTITLSNGAEFVKYPDVNKITFIITSNVINNIKINSGYITYDEKVVQDGQSYGVDKNGVERGYLTLKLDTSTGLSVGTIFLVEKADGTQAAYKVENCNAIAPGVFNVNYVKPDIDEVFSEFEYNATTKLDQNSNVDFDYMDGQETLDNSELAMSIVSIFGSKPQFNISTPKLEDGKVIVDVTITIPNVVTVEGYASSDLVLTLHNVMSAEATANIDKEHITDQFSLFATIRNDVTTTVSLGANANYGAELNVPELIDKLVQLANESADDATAVPLFKWSVPIANGAASITYNADLLFRFSFGGSIDVAAHAQLDYQVGVQYTKADGISAIAQELDGNGFDSVNVSLQGMAELKVGLRQALSFDILAGVLGIGIQAEIGNYNRLYGYGESDNLVDADPDYFAGGVYFEGGFYYDVDLSYGIKIGSLLNLADKADIVSGEVKGYEAGNRYLTLGLEATVQQHDLTAKNTVVPSIYLKKMYDIVTGERFDVVATNEELEFNVPASNDLVVENGVIKVNKSVSNIVVEASLKDADLNKVSVTYSFSMAAPVLENNTVYVDKSSVKDIKDTVNLTVYYEGFENGATVTSEDVTASVTEKTADTAKVSFPVKEALRMANGKNVVTFDVAGTKLALNVDVTGSVAWDQFRQGNTVDIFTADQVVSMINSGVAFDGITVNVTEDIDMNGAQLGSMAKFAGVLNGNAKTISNFTVTGMAGNNAGFIAVNEGTIDNLKLVGDVNVSISAKTCKDYAVAGIAAVNNGVVKNCSFVGNVNVNSTSLAAFVNIDAAAIVAKGDAAGCSAKTEEAATTVTVTVSFDLANVTVRVGGLNSVTKLDGVTGKVACVNGADVPVITKYTIAQ